MDTYCVEAISDYDLYNNKYCIYLLTIHINNFSLKTLLNTQHLTAHFCVKYILDCPIELGYESSGIYTKTIILSKQKHITSEEFDEAYELYNNQNNSNN
jgi:hypothetical protein